MIDEIDQLQKEIKLLEKFSFWKGFWLGMFIMGVFSICVVALNLWGSMQ